jgi:hypothetical protein
MGSQQRGGGGPPVPRSLRAKRDGRGPAAQRDLPVPARAKWMNVAVAVSASVSLICLLLIVGMWVTKQYSPWEPRADETPVHDLEEVEAFLASEPLQDSAEDPAVFIRTGVMIQSVEFKGPYTAQVSGYLWQLYPSTAADFDKGVVFPEADSTTMNKVYEAEQNGEVLVGWNFKTVLREQFDYAQYPLDRQQLWLRMWHIDFERNVFLVPDFTAYESMDPPAKPGLDPSVVLENWDIDLTYFSLRPTTYNADFGIDGYDPGEPVPELYFNIGIERNVLNPLIARAIAPVVILLQLFVIVMVIGRDNKRLEQFGVRPGAVLFTCAAFVFAVLIAQNALRDEIKWHGVVYLEFLHVITYFVILGVAANSVLLVARPDYALFNRGNTMVRLLYWPIISVSMLIITLGVLEVRIGPSG